MDSNDHMKAAITATHTRAHSFSTWAETGDRPGAVKVTGQVWEQDVWVSDQAWGQDGCILPKFFVWVFMERDEVEVKKKYIYMAF